MVLISNFKSIFAVLGLIIISICSSLFLGNEKYMLVAIVAAIIALIPFFIKFERSEISTRELVVIAVMVAICTISRILFIFVPHFKPVTALVIITGMYLGCDAGFMTGAFTALISNMQYGQGPWTVFQMAVWGLIGFMAGFLNEKKRLEKSKLLLYAFSAFSGIVFSLIMDIYTTISLDRSFVIARYLLLVASSFPVMLSYVVSNIVFIMFFKLPIGKKLNRIKEKYGLFNKK